MKKENNFAFIDSQNLNLGVRDLGWKLDWKRFRIYLKEKYRVKKAYMFFGFLPENLKLYVFLKKIGYSIIFKDVTKDRSGKVKGNIDAELVLQVMHDFQNYDKAIIVSSDGDFACIVKYLYKRNKLKAVISPSRQKCSVLLTKSAKEKSYFIDNLKNKIGFRK